jgi:flagella basal body P-ring formation protein FlgA
MGRTTVLLVVVGLTAGTAAAGELRLRDEAAVAGGMVRLADLAEISGLDASQAEPIAHLPLFPAPAAGKERVLRRGELLELLALAEIDPRQFTWSGADQITIRRSAEAARATGSQSPGAPARRGAARHRQPPAAAVEHALVCYLQQQGDGGVAWSVVPAIPPRYREPLANAEQITVASGQPPFTGRQSFEIVARIQGHERRIPIEADVTALPRVAVALRPIAKGELIERGDLELVALAPDSVGLDLPLPAEQVVGQEAVRVIQPGVPITMEMVQAPRLVRRGDQITIRSLAPGVAVTTSGKALQDGTLGEEIRIELDDTRQKLVARVSGAKSVELGRDRVAEK